MPVHIDNAVARGDIIAYLKQLDSKAEAGG